MRLQELKKKALKVFGIDYLKAKQDVNKYESYLLLLGRIENDDIQTINHVKGYKRMIQLYNKLHCLEYYKKGIESKSINTLNKALKIRLDNI
jgi:hypothetical protein